MGIKYSVNEEFFDTWSVEMAYVLGYLYADGNIEDSPSIRGKYVRVGSTDLDRIELIRELLQSDHSITVRDLGGNRKKLYLLRIGSARLFDALAGIGMTPAKSLTMQFPDVPKEYLSAFILGYFDGDGCVALDKKSDGSVKRMLSIFTCGSFSFIQSLHNILRTELSIAREKISPHGSVENVYQLRYSTRDSIRLFKYIYRTPQLRQVALIRKYDIFTEYFELRGLELCDLDEVLTKKGPVVKKKHDDLQNRYCAGAIPAWTSKEI